MKILLTIVSFIALGIGLWAGLNGKAGVLTVGFLSFVALLFTANLDRIAEFKASGTGIEAKTREVLKDAEVTITELRSLAKQVGIVTLSLVKRSGRIGGYSDSEEDDIKESILGVLKEVGIPHSERDETLKEWWLFTELDYSYYILGAHTIPQGASPEEIGEWKALRSGVLENIPTPEDLEAFLEKNQLMTKEVEERILDYKHFIKFQSHRRPEVWQDRENWGRLKKT